MAACIFNWYEPPKCDAPLLCVFLPQLSHQWAGLGPHGASDAEAEPSRCRPHPALVRTDPTSYTRYTSHTLHIKQFYSVPVSLVKLSEGCRVAAGSVCAETLGHAATDSRRLLFFWPFGGFDFSQADNSGLITPRHILMSPLCSKHCLSPVVTVSLSKRKQRSSQTNLSQGQWEEGRKKENQQWIENWN